jgi:hypothetical protein
MNAGNASVNGGYWITLMLINAGLAQAKGRSGFNWFGVSLFLGPIATLLIVLWKPLPTRDPSVESS